MDYRKKTARLTVRSARYLRGLDLVLRGIALDAKDAVVVFSHFRSYLDFTMLSAKIAQENAQTTLETTREKPSPISL